MTRLLHIYAASSSNHHERIPHHLDASLAPTNGDVSIRLAYLAPDHPRPRIQYVSHLHSASVCVEMSWYPGMVSTAAGH